MFTTWQFFAPLNHKYLGSTMKNVENSRTIPYILSLWKTIPTNGLFWRSRATTVIRPRDTHVENDLSASSQNSIEIHSRDIVFCRLKLIIVHISCWGVSWIHRADPCLYYFEIFWSVLFKLCFALPCIFFFFYFNIFLPEGQDKIYLSHPVTARALYLKMWVFIFIAYTAAGWNKKHFK